MKLLRKKHAFKGKDGKQYVGYNYYLAFDNGSVVAIRPSFKEDARVLYVLSIPADAESKAE